MNSYLRRAAWVLAWFFAWPAWAEVAKPEFDRIFHDFEVTMLLIDPASGQIVDANLAAARFYGFEQARLRSMTIQHQYPWCAYFRPGV